jgi:hypothetical protein
MTYVVTTGLWFFLGIPVSTTNKTNRHDITEILLKVALNTINLNLLLHHQFLKVLFWLGIIVDSFL